MDKVQVSKAWWGLKKIESNSETGITYKWYHKNYAASDSDVDGVLIKITTTVDGNVTTDVFQQRMGSWTARATGW